MCSADAVIVLPNNKNIVMAATAAASVADRPAAVVPTTSVPAAFAALLEYSSHGELEALVPAMSEAAATVHTGEVTVAVKDAKAKVGDIRAGQVIGILDDDEIVVVGESIDEVAFGLASLLAADAETLTLFAGEEYDDACTRCHESAHRGRVPRSRDRDPPRRAAALSADRLGRVKQHY